MVTSDYYYYGLVKDTHIHTQPFNSLLSGTTWVSQYQKCKTNLDFIEARDSERQWHQLGHVQVCTSFQIDNHAYTPPHSFLQATCSSWCQTDSVNALKASIKDTEQLTQVWLTRVQLVSDWLRDVTVNRSTTTRVRLWIQCG